MYTEDDTFLKLKRIPSSEMTSLAFSISVIEWNKMLEDDTQEQFFNLYGWTYIDWYNAYRLV